MIHHACLRSHQGKRGFIYEILYPLNTNGKEVQGYKNNITKPIQAKSMDIGYPCPGAMHENAVVADSAYAAMAVSIPL